MLSLQYMEPQEVEIISRADSLRVSNDQYFTQRATQDRDFIYEKLKELAEGTWLFFKAPDGSQTRAYKRPPDVKALAMLLDRSAGKINSEDDPARKQSQGLIQVQTIIKQLVDGKSSKQISEGVSIDTVLE